MREKIHEFSWKVGGESGEGIDTTGELFATALNRMGFYVYAYRHFPSRIRGGHTNYKLRIADRQVRSVGDRLDCLIAFDQGTIDWNWPEMHGGGMIVYDSTNCKGALPPDRPDLVAYPVPLTELAQEVGDAIMKNMVAVGVSAAFCGLPLDPFQSLVESTFKSKGAKVVDANRALIEKGYRYSKDHFQPHVPFTVTPVPPAAGKHRYLVSGNEAISYGALAAGCRFVAAYPITPATEVMSWLQGHFRKFGHGVVVQCEDELSAINMAVGAAFTGVRAIASTSGPGFALMSEGMGLAGATEQPVVIVDVQRAGPSTGLPTKTEQGDLGHMIHGGHGEFPRIVVTPLTVEDCFYAATDAFNLAEQYQCPVILAPDLSLAMCKQTVEGLDFDYVHIERGHIADDEELAVNAIKNRFKRYQVTENGVSPRSLPSQRGGQHLVTGSEHDELGYVNDTPKNRAAQHAKRLRKLNSFFADLAAGPGGVARAFKYDGPEHVDVLLLGFGSTTGPIAEAAAALEGEGVTVARGNVRIPHPFPAAEVAAAIERAKRVVVAENNGSAQLLGLIREHVFGAGLAGPADLAKLDSLLKFDGTPFMPGEIADHLKEVTVSGHAR